MSTFLKPYKVGEYVDIKANAACQRGMPHKYYQGCVSISPLIHTFHLVHLVLLFLICVSTKCTCSRTGIIYNVTPRAVGVLINKRVGNRYIQKRVNLRVEHIKHSQGRQVFLDRVKKNEKARIEAKEKGGESQELLVVGIGH